MIPTPRHRASFRLKRLGSRAFCGAVSGGECKGVDGGWAGSWKRSGDGWRALGAQPLTTWRAHWMGQPSAVYGVRRKGPRSLSRDSPESERDTPHGRASLSPVAAADGQVGRIHEDGGGVDAPPGLCPLDPGPRSWTVAPNGGSRSGGGLANGTTGSKDQEPRVTQALSMRRGASTRCWRRPGAPKSHEMAD